MIVISLFFCWLFIRELTNPTERFDLFSAGYLLVIGGLAVAFAWSPVKTLRFESFLSEKASIIAERPNIKVKCNSIFGSIVSGRGLDYVAGTANIDKGEIYFEHGWCVNFMEYLDNPRNASKEVLFGMHLFTHEVMHVRGEKNEAKTDCQAIQRNHQVGELLGVSAFVARSNAEKYYETLYRRHPYFDKECAPGGKYDERLPNSIW